MAYIGTDINYGNIASQTGVGNGSTTPIATLDYTVPTSSSIMVTLDGVTQVPTTDYTAVGTTLTFTSSVASPIAILVYFLGRSLDIGTPATGTVTNASVDASAAIAQSKLVDIVNADVDASAAIVTSKLSGAVTSIASHGLATSATTDTTNAANIASGTLPVARGGTGAATHTATNVLIGNGTSAITSIAPGADGQVLTSTGSAWQSEAVASAGANIDLSNLSATPGDDGEKKICHAWVTFNAGGSIHDSFNVSSVTDRATGRFTANFTASLPNTYHASLASCFDGGTTDGNRSAGTSNNSNADWAYVNVWRDHDGTEIDVNYVAAAYFGGW